MTLIQGDLQTLSICEIVAKVKEKKMKVTDIWEMAHKLEVCHESAKFVPTLLNEILFSETSP